jgi:hypothetical protein
MKQSYIEFNPQRDQMMQRLLEMREKYPDEFPAAWIASGKSWRNLDLLDLENPGLEFVCVSFRMWLEMARHIPPTLRHTGPIVGGMILVDMDRLGEPPPSLSDLVGLSDEEREWLEADD